MPLDSLSPEQAKARFGQLMHEQTRTYRQFDDPSGGVWRPEFHAGELLRYRLYLEQKSVKTTWRRTR